MKRYLTALDLDSKDFLPHPPDLFLQENNKSKIERAKKKILTRISILNLLMAARIPVTGTGAWGLGMTAWLISGVVVFWGQKSKHAAKQVEKKGYTYRDM